MQSVVSISSLPLSDEDEIMKHSPPSGMGDEIKFFLVERATAFIKGDELVQIVRT